MPRAASRGKSKGRADEPPLPYDPPGDDAPEPRFLSVEDVLQLHHDLLARFGGDAGLLNPGALDAAVAQPRMTAFGRLLHPTLVEQAAAYLFHLVANHPFCDGNKRVGLLAALVFLRDNGAEVDGDQATWYELTMAVAAGTCPKRELTRRLAELVRPA